MRRHNAKVPLVKTFIWFLIVILIIPPVLTPCVPREKQPWVIWDKSVLLATQGVKCMKYCSYQNGLSTQCVKILFAQHKIGPTHDTMYI